MKKTILIFLITILSLAGLFEGACYIFGADTVYSFCIGVVIIAGLIALPAMKGSRKPQPYDYRFSKN